MTPYSQKTSQEPLKCKYVVVYTTQPPSSLSQCNTIQVFPPPAPLFFFLAVIYLPVLLLSGKNRRRSCKLLLGSAGSVIVPLPVRPARKAWRPAIVGSPNPPPGGEEDTGSSSGDTDEEGEGATESQPSAPHQSHHASSLSPHPELLTTMQAYGFEIEPPSKQDCLLYER